MEPASVLGFDIGAEYIWTLYIRVKPDILIRKNP
jgi:hypothetical protein